ncbi:MAG: ABC transporter permease [Sedimentisphaerales bacterium]|nr:ABC transporter permease [Sedimentisphaerales bacterium]
MLPTVLLVSIIVFVMMRLVPGDVVDAMIGQWEWATGEDRSALEHALGLDVPIYTQYGRWLGVVPQDDGRFNGVFQGNLGISLWKQAPVIDEIVARIPITFELGILAIVIAQLIALPIGLFSALRQDAWPDYIARSFAILCIAIPGFWLGTMIIVFPSIWWGWSPPISITPFIENPIVNLKIFILPAIVLGMSMSGMTMRMTRTMMLEVLRQDYIRTAWAKGLRERVTIVRHALKNALIPVITIIGLQVPVLVGGTVIIEQIFVLPGMGSLMVTAALNRDYTIVSGGLVVLSFVIVLSNLLVDITYGFLDPRVHYK